MNIFPWYHYNDDIAAFLKFLLSVFISRGQALALTGKIPIFDIVSFEPALQHIFPNKKIILDTGMNLSIEVERS